MKKYILLLIGVFMVMNISLGVAQDRKHPDRKYGSVEEIQKKRADYLIKELSLTDAESDAFIPLVNEYMAAKFKSYRDYKTQSKEFRNKGVKTEADHNKSIDSYLNSEAEKVKLEKEFYTKIRKILSAEKVYKYRNAEHQYMHKMLDSHRTRNAK